MQAENAALRRIDNRRGQQRTVDAAVADGKGATLQLVDRQLVFRARSAKSAMACSISAKLIRSAFRKTGTTRPLPPPMAMPMS